MGQIVEIRTHTAGKKFRYLIKNIQGIDIQLVSQVVSTPMPEQNDSQNVLTKADGNTIRVNVTWIIHDEALDTVLPNHYGLDGSPTNDGTTPVAFYRFSTDTGFKLADHQVRFLLEPNNALLGAGGANTPKASGIQVDRLTDVYQIVIGNTGFSRQGLIENLQITKAGTSPATWNASLSFVCGNVITGGGSSNDQAQGGDVTTP